MGMDRSSGVPNIIREPDGLVILFNTIFFSDTKCDSLGSRNQPVGSKEGKLLRLRCSLLHSRPSGLSGRAGWHYITPGSPKLETLYKFSSIANVAHERYSILAYARLNTARGDEDAQMRNFV
jgi:hypothetical protein